MLNKSPQQPFQRHMESPKILQTKQSLIKASHSDEEDDSDGDQPIKTFQKWIILTLATQHEKHECKKHLSPFQIFCSLPLLSIVFFASLLCLVRACDFQFFWKCKAGFTLYGVITALTSEKYLCGLFLYLNGKKRRHIWQQWWWETINFATMKRGSKGGKRYRGRWDAGFAQTQSKEALQ